MAVPSLEYWLRGPVEAVPFFLQPVAHALLQAREEIKTALIDFPEEKLWDTPAGVASVAFHLQHLSGVLDRLFTYAKGGQLNGDQLLYLAAEGKRNDAIHISSLLQHFNVQVDTAITQLINTPVTLLTEIRGVGRQQIPSTTLGLLFHAAEHTMRHTGQLLVTAAILRLN